MYTQCMSHPKLGQNGEKWGQNPKYEIYKTKAASKIHKVANFIETFHSNLPNKKN